MSLPEKAAMARERLSRMKQPTTLQSTGYVAWSNGNGTDVWEMIGASITGDVERVRSLAAKDRNLLNCSYEYLTPIRFAVRENHKELVEYFITAGVKPLTEFGDSLLTIARDRNYEELAGFLSATLNRLYHISDDGEMIPSLIRAFDRKAVKERLLREPRLLHAADARGNQPIHWAVLTRQMELVEWLLQQGADINSVRPDGARPLDLTNGDYYYRNWYRDLPPTGLQKHEVLLGYLIAKGADYDISVAAKVGDYHRVKTLLEQDPALANKLPLHTGPYSGRPIRNASGAGHYEIVKLLLEYGADPNAPEPGIAPWGAALHAAITRKHLPITRLLLEHGANPNGHVESSGNCLWMAKHIGAPKEIIDLVITYGGKTNLEQICYDGDVETLTQMLEANPQLSFNAEEHRVILEHQKMVEVVLRYQPSFLKQFSLRGFNDPVLARWLIEKGLDPNNTDWLGVAPLHRAAADGRTELAAVLLEAGADINAVDTDYFSTPLGWAARQGQAAMVNWLLGKGANPALPKEESWALPLAWARRRGHVQVADILAKNK